MNIKRCFDLGLINGYWCLHDEHDFKLTRCNIRQDAGVGVPLTEEEQLSAIEHFNDKVLFFLDAAR